MSYVFPRASAQEDALAYRIDVLKTEAARLTDYDGFVPVYRKGFRAVREEIIRLEAELRLMRRSS